MEIILYALIAVNTTFHLTVLAMILHREAMASRAKPTGEQPDARTPITAGTSSFKQSASVECLQRLRLTRRETSVANMMIEGLSYQEISEKLGLSIRSVQHHASKTFKKAGASSRRDFEQLVKEEAPFVSKGFGASQAQR